MHRLRIPTGQVGSRFRVGDNVDIANVHRRLGADHMRQYEFRGRLVTSLGLFDLFANDDLQINGVDLMGEDGSHIGLLIDGVTGGIGQLPIDVSQPKRLHLLPCHVERLLV